MTENRPCSECGSRDWPSSTTECPLCYEPKSEENLDVSFDDEQEAVTGAD
jgi:hypothetical protein